MRTPIDKSYYQDNRNTMPDNTRSAMIALIRCDDNKVRWIAKPINLPRVSYYHYDFESGDDIILETSEE
jgi:hypothetical protein